MNQALGALGSVPASGQSAASNEPSWRPALRPMERPVQLKVVSYQKADFPEINWLKRLLPGFTVEQVEDVAQAKVIPNSIVICKRLGQLRPALLQTISATPGMVLFHISDEWYWDRLEPYRCFTHVLRNYHHSALRQEGITQIPMGPSRFSDGKPEIRPAGERRHRWCFVGNLASTRGLMVRQLENIKPRYLHITGTRGQSATWLTPDEYLSVLRDSIFVPCPMGNVNLESFRLYEALDCGAIPIVERRPFLDYFTQLFGPHPLPSVCHWEEARSVIHSLCSDPVRLQDKQVEIREWWRQFETRVSNQVNSALNAAVGRKTRMHFAAGVPSRIRGFGEMLKHQNGPTLLARSKLTLRRLCGRHT